jgi:hypothetical protein
MKKVVCINDRNLPRGAKVEEGKEYLVETEHTNHLDQRVYVLKGTSNSGTTKWGMRWYGYDATRFTDVEDNTMEFKIVAQETNFTYN